MAPRAAAPTAPQTACAHCTCIPAGASRGGRGRTGTWSSSSNTTAQDHMSANLDRIRQDAVIAYNTVMCYMHVRHQKAVSAYDCRPTLLGAPVECAELADDGSGTDFEE